MNYTPEKNFYKGWNVLCALTAPEIALFSRLTGYASQVVHQVPTSQNLNASKHALAGVWLAFFSQP
jgi:hypothetical protein